MQTRLENAISNERSLSQIDVLEQSRASFDSLHLAEHLQEILSRVQDTITPVWPLKDYVAVNPYSGMTNRKFTNAREFLRVFSDCEMLMPLSHYADQFSEGQFSTEDIESAVQELTLHHRTLESPPTAARVVDRLNQVIADRFNTADESAMTNVERKIRTVAEILDRQSDEQWSSSIRDEVSQICASHYDEGQANWASPFKHLSLYTAWRSSALHNYNLEILGLRGLRSYVSKLPHTPEASIVYSLNQLNVPRNLWESFLLCQAFDLPGWSAWTKYQATEKQSDVEAFISLLAIRLAYDAALSKAFHFRINWSVINLSASAGYQTSELDSGEDAVMRHVLLKACEISYQNKLLSQLTVASPNSDLDDQNLGAETTATERKLAQMVFCIDVRSERIRRHLEAASEKIETFGFAGFFGMPIEYVPLGATVGSSQVPALLKPQFQVHESVLQGTSSLNDDAVRKRYKIRSMRKTWKGFKTSAVGMFTFVETLGLLYGAKLFSRAVGGRESHPDPRFDGIASNHQPHLGPNLDKLEDEGIDAEKQADIAESMLRGIGLTSGFAKLVVLCGHGSETQNNPLKAGLDCGACCGHSGEPNARFAAMLLNQSSIRRAMAERGIAIPSDTHFLAGLHNTTTDQIKFFDLHQLPSSLQQELEQLRGYSSMASASTRIERMPQVESSTVGDLMRRCGDWSEVRPEWGLAGNAAFIVAPRSMTKDCTLDGRSFLHSYDYTRDNGFKTLETIMTAPMVVAHWINMQYYASTVDNRMFGSGTKTVHNVVGRFGLLSGNAGDLKIGLPHESLHTGKQLQHDPLRLLVVIAAPKQAIQDVIDKHTLVEDLATGGWLNLIAIEDGKFYRYAEDGAWEKTLSP